ncbi:TonB-dependent receptor [Campylobacter sp. FMV-PI01]|uniref:TonB-dependent receptor n=1 Tax=Campylobacter portucalensis TaxID=2608384 RepID=A0A6L5WII3_9BACT|nr:TonB-dependent receptor [Campylobacter portucalensis]MSN97040.1 TonB-dependent receptor [Campylobacter portucalensis]
MPRNKNLVYLFCVITANLAANENSINLDEVVVTASGFSKTLQYAPASIDIVSKDVIEKRSFSNIYNVLDDISGVSIEGGGSRKLDNSSVYIRGLSGDYTLFMSDGKPQGSNDAYYNGFGVGMEANWLPPAGMIERIEVIKGPMSSLYGSEAMGGVINVITKKVPNKFTGSIGSEITLQEDKKSGNYTNNRFYLGTPILKDKIGFIVYGSTFNRIEDKFSGGFRQKDKYDINSKLNFVITDGSNLELFVGYAKTKNIGTKNKTGDTFLENDRRQLSITHDHNWADGANTTSFISHENVHIDNGKTTKSAYKKTIYNTKTLLPFSKHILTFGVDFKKEETKHAKARFHGSNNNTNLKRWQGALFVEDEFNIADDLIFTFGLRYDKNEHYGSEFIPRFYAIYNPNDYLTIKGGVGKGYKSPSLKQSDPKIGEQSGGGKAQKMGIGSIDIGNYDLKPESSINYELSMLLKFSQFEAQTTIFYTNFKDKIDKTTNCDSGAKKKGDLLKCLYNGKNYNRIHQYINVDEANIRGLELDLSYKFDKFKASANYTYSKSELKTGKYKGQPFFNTPKHMANLKLDYNYNRNLNLWTKIKYKGSTREKNGKMVKSYIISDMGVSYGINDNFTIFGGIYNVFDKSLTNEEYGKSLDGRRYSVGFEAKF